MDYSMRKAVANQGMGYILHTVRCSECYFIPQSMDEDDPETPCPNCGKVDTLGELGPNSYFQVANWVAQYAVTKNRRDHVAAVILFCAWVESLLEALKRTRLDANTKLQEQFAGQDLSDIAFRDLFPGSQSALLDKAPKELRPFWKDFKKLHNRRHEFLHGSGVYKLHEKHAHDAMDLASLAISAYVWLNNQYCIKT